MSEPTLTQLQQAYQLIKNGEKEEAISVLRPMLTVDPNNADGWWLLANAVSDPAEQRSALEKVVMLRPDHAQAREKLQQLKTGSEFSFDSPPSAVGFGDTLQKAKREPPLYVQPVQPAKKGNSPILVILAVIGVIALLVCGVCFVITLQGANMVGQVMSTVVSSITSMPGSFPQELSDISNLQSNGNINKGDTVSGQMNDPFGAEGYKFSGETGQNITITVSSKDKSFLPGVGLYDPSGKLVDKDSIFSSAGNSSASNQNATVTVRLPSSGTYTIVVQGFLQGKFTLTLQ
ncbi:MAG: pre-peptidase C-terminal domain-containing protein [Chloroflexota bacterium]